jgi:phosphohistidine phosphatase SixA
MIAGSLHNRAKCAVFMLLAACAQVAVESTASAGQDMTLWSALRSGEHIALLRHAFAPGTGDPADFMLGDCSTQRNLSRVGREQAERIGARMRENGIAQARVYTSQWCRAQDTAALLRLGPVAELPLLNSFFQSRDREQTQTRTLARWLAKQDLSRPLVLVTHQVNITALTRVYADAGDIVVVKRTADGKLRVVGTLKTE